MRIEKLQFDILRNVSDMEWNGLKSDLAFCHPGIHKISNISSEDGTIELEISENLDETERKDLREQVARVVKMSVSSFRFVEESPPLWNHDSGKSYHGNGAVSSFANQYLTTLGPGQYSYHGSGYKLYDFIRNKILNIAKDMNAEVWHLPSIEMTHDLITETGYFSSHPQLVTFGYRLPPHYDTIRKFADNAKMKKLSAPEDSHILEYTGFILEPFVCHNIYRSLNNQNIAKGKIISAEGKCYRYEGFRFLPLLRQWEFTMREIVLVGEHDFVMAERQRCIDLTRSLIEELDLNARLEIATDPFFVSAAASARTFQMMQSTKLEMNLRIDDEISTAAVSFNIHGQHFTRPMKIYSSSGDILETSCCAYGIERWMAAFIARWSDDPAHWPVKI